MSGAQRERVPTGRARVLMDILRDRQGAGDPEWISSADLAALGRTKSQYMHATFESAVSAGWMATKISETRDGHRTALWMLLPAGCNALQRADDLERKLRAAGMLPRAGDAAQQRKRLVVYTPDPTGVAGIVLRTLANWPDGRWVSTDELTAAAPELMRVRGKFSGYLLEANTKGAIERLKMVGSGSLWRRPASPDVVPTFPPGILRDDCGADDLATPEEDAVADSEEERQRSARWAAWQPVDGTLAARAVRWINDQPQHAWMAPAIVLTGLQGRHGGVLLDDAPPLRDVVDALRPAVLAGLVCARPSAFDVRLLVYAAADVKTGRAAASGVAA